jgi:hypothetical protein
MQFVSNIFSKVAWFIFIALCLGGASVFALRYLSPPPVATLPNKSSNSQPTNKPQPQATITPPLLQTPPADDSPDPAASPPFLVPSSPSASQTPSPSDTPASDFNANPSALPALALPNQVVLNTPKKLERGAVLSIFDNVDNNSNPDPINYSPTSKKKVSGLSLIFLEEGFQEVSGYFLVEKTATYAFVLSFPDKNYPLRLNNLRLRIDGQPLSNVKGDSLTLEKGWHRVDLFLYEPNNSTASHIQVKWGLEGSNLKPLQVWREVS